jgi:hypothetical protein
MPRSRYFGISGVPGLEDRQLATLQGFSFETRLHADGSPPWAVWTNDHRRTAYGVGYDATSGETANGT